MGWRRRERRRLQRTLAAPPWQQESARLGFVGCGGRSRAVADVSADADPYSGVAVYDSSADQGRVVVHGWWTIGGTSVASPTIASTFALAGGAGTGAGGKAVEYPAQTLYENLAAHPGSLHDVISGSNGECTLGFDELTGLSDCSLAEEAASCSEEAICVARAGYDGPTGVGTPDGIAAFKPNDEENKQQNEEKRIAEEQRIAEEKRTAEEQRRAEEARLAEEKQHEEERQREEHKKQKEKEEKEEEEKQSGGSGGGGSNEAGAGGAGNQVSTVASGAPLTTGVQPTAPLSSTSTIVPILSALELTKTATAALSRDTRQEVSRIAFAFTLNVPARVRVTLAKLVLTHGHRRWQTLPYSLTIAAARGRDSAHLSAHRTLAPGRYRLRLTPMHGVSRTLTFRVG